MPLSPLSIISYNPKHWGRAAPAQPWQLQLDSALCLLRRHRDASRSRSPAGR